MVGQTVDGKPLISADSEHFDAKLQGDTVTSSGAIRDSTVEVARSYKFTADAIHCGGLSLKETRFNELLNLWIANPERGKLTECWEMIPILSTKKITLLNKDVVRTFDEADALVDTIIIDRGGFGVRIELDGPGSCSAGGRAPC